MEERSLVVESNLEYTFSAPECDRLHICGMGHMTKDSGSPVDGMILQRNANEVWSASEDEFRKIEFRFRRCIDIEKMISGKSDGTYDADDADEADYWKIWVERIEI